MPSTNAPFLSSMLFAVLVPVFIVMTTAFVAIPYSLGGHPGEASVVALSSTDFHPT